MTFHLRATVCHLSYGITQCYLPPNTSERLNPSQTDRYSIYLPRRDGRLRWPTWPVTYWDGLPSHKRSPIQVLTRQCTAGNWTHNLLIKSLMP